MKTSARIAFIFVIGLLLTACGTQATALSTLVPATILTPTVSSTPLPTTTPTLTPEPSPTPLPAYADWMESYVEGLVPVIENGITFLVNNLPDGRSIKVFEYANDEWRPSYLDMDKFVREDKTFDLEAAMQTMFMRMGPVADVGSRPAMSVNMEDYRRFVEKTQSIWNGLKGLKPGVLQAGSGGQHVVLSADLIFFLNIPTTVGQWQLIGWAKNPAGEETVFVIATAEGPLALLNVGDVGYTIFDYSEPIEEGVAEWANQTSTQFGRVDVIDLLMETSKNPNFIGTVNADRLELMRAYIRGMGIDARAIYAMMHGPKSAQIKAMKYLFEHYPAPIYKFQGDY